MSMVGANIIWASFESVCLSFGIMFNTYVQFNRLKISLSVLESWSATNKPTKIVEC